MQSESESQSCSVMSDSLWPHGLYSPWNSLGQNTGVVSLSFLQGILPTQVSNPGLSHWRWILYQLSHNVSPRILVWVAYPLSMDLPNLGIEPGSPTFQADSLPTELSGKSACKLALVWHLGSQVWRMFSAFPNLWFTVPKMFIQAIWLVFNTCFHSENLEFWYTFRSPQ